MQYLQITPVHPDMRPDVQGGAGARAAGGPALAAAEGAPALTGLADGPAALARALLSAGPGSAAGAAAARAGLGGAAAAVLAAAGGAHERGAAAALAELSPAGVLSLLEARSPSGCRGTAAPQRACPHGHDAAAAVLRAGRGQSLDLARRVWRGARQQPCRPAHVQTAPAQPEALRGRRQALRAESAPGAAGAVALLRPGVARALVLLARPAHRAAAAAWPAAGGGGAAGARAAALAALDLLHAPFCAAATPGAVLRDLQAVRARASLPGACRGRGCSGRKPPVWQPCLQLTRDPVHVQQLTKPAVCAE